MALTTTSPELSHVACRIAEAHAACEHAMRSGLAHALEAGRLLIQAREQIRHGRWLEWVQSECGIAPRLAQRYAQLARELPKLTDADATRVSHLSMRQALALVADNSRTARRIPDLSRADELERASEDPHAESGLRTREQRLRKSRRRDRQAQRRAQSRAAMRQEVPRSQEPTRSEWRLAGLPEPELGVLLEELERLVHWFRRLDERLTQDYEYPIPRLADRCATAIWELRERLTYDREQLHHAVFGLKELLAEGPVPATEIRRWARKAGISQGLLVLSRKILGVGVRLAPAPEEWALTEDADP